MAWAFGGFNQSNDKCTDMGKTIHTLYFKVEFVVVCA